MRPGRIGGVMLGLSGLWEHRFGPRRPIASFGLAMEPSVEALRGLGAQGERAAAALLARFRDGLPQEG